MYEKKTATFTQLLHCLTQKLVLGQIWGSQDPVCTLTWESDRDIASCVVVTDSPGNLRSASSDVSPSRPPKISHGTRHWCYALHAVLVGLHVTLLAVLVHHPEHSVIIPFDSKTMTIGLSAFLQATYTVC